MFKIFATVTCLTALVSAVIGQADYHDDERQGRGACNGVRISRLCNILQYYYADVIIAIIAMIDRLNDSFLFFVFVRSKQLFRSLLFQDGICWKEPIVRASGWTADPGFVWAKASVQKPTENQWAGVSRSILAVQVTIVTLIYIIINYILSLMKCLSIL
jgi:hypothetical protein